MPELRWEGTVFDDPMGGKIVLWPYLPCVRMPAKMRPREWDGLALLCSGDEIQSLREEEEQDKASPGIHVESASASGTTLGMLVKDLEELEIDGPSIPDPERIRLLRHAENSRGGMPIYSIEPDMEDEDWADLQSKWADEQVKLRNLIATIGRSRRWVKSRKSAISMVNRSKWASPDLGAAATVCYAWWSEEGMALTEDLSRIRTRRISSRLRGALADMRDFKWQENNSTDSDDGPILLTPVQQAYLPSLQNSLFACEDVEKVVREG